MAQSEFKEDSLNGSKSEKVELFLSCNDLIDKDVMGKSDPFVVVYIRERHNNKFKLLGRTEVIENNQNPKFNKTFALDYFFEEEQLLRFDVYDRDAKNVDLNQLSKHDLIGSCNMILGQIIHESGQELRKKLLKKGKLIKNKKVNLYSSLTVNVEPISTANEKIEIQFTAKDLPKMDALFGKCDPYFIIYRLNQNKEKVQVFKSDVIQRNYKPVWKPLHIDSQKLCNCDPTRPIFIEVWDWDASNKDDIVGTVQTTLNELKKKPSDLKLLHDHKSNKNYGKLQVNFINVTPTTYGFLDYFRGDCQISLSVAIDFTGSNGHPEDHQSLHHIYGNKPSQYQLAIREIGNIVAVYDFDKKFPIYGFGANLNNEVRHDFALNFNENNPEVIGIHGIEQTYLKSIKSEKFQLSGPTYFTPILKKIHKISKEYHNNNIKNNALQYMLLLLLTDGIINDMKETRNEIVTMANASLPISIIIVGIGSEDFSKMNELDSDDQKLQDSHGNQAQRDIVQFVAINNYKQLTDLSKETLKEIPAQFLSYVKTNNIVPKPKSMINNNNNNSNNDAFKIKENENEFKENDNQVLNNKLSDELVKKYESYNNAPLPPGWERVYNENDVPYYVNHNTFTTQWEHPYLTQNK